jgi:hypothetical protein
MTEEESLLPLPLEKIIFSVPLLSLSFFFSMRESLFPSPDESSGGMCCNRVI